MESKIVQYQVVEPNSLRVEGLRSGKQVKARSQKHVQGPRTLDRAYVEQEKAHIAAAEALEVEKTTNREARRLAKEQKAKEARDRAEASTKAGGGTEYSGCLRTRSCQYSSIRNCKAIQIPSEGG